MVGRDGLAWRQGDARGAIGRIIHVDGPLQCPVRAETDLRCMLLGRRPIGASPPDHPRLRDLDAHAAPDRLADAGQQEVARLVHARR
jgi:hypothetical protein